MFNLTPDGTQKNRRLGNRDVLLASIAGLDSALWELKCRDCGLRNSDLEIFHRLSNSTKNRNIFFDPDFFSASHRRLGHRMKKLITLTESLDEATEMKLAFPVQPETVGLPAVPVMRVWSHNYGPLSTPLMNTDDVSKTVEVFVQSLKDVDFGSEKGIVFQDIPIQTDFVQALLQHGEVQDSVIVESLHERAILYKQDPEKYLSATFSKKRQKEMSRLTRRLQSMGKFEFNVETDLMGALLRFEEFLLLETRGWKGRQGTSLHMIKKTAAFARQAIFNLVESGACRIYSLRLNNRAIASTIVFRSGNWYFPWKIAHDEQYNRFSVGKMLMVRVTQDLLSLPGFEGADSLAGPDNVMINHVWPERQEMGHVILATGAKASKNAKTIHRAIIRKYQWKKKLKSILGL